jgi:DNA-binding XRE family transcriptional regulator
MSSLQKYIRRVYGNQQNCADALGVDRKTVYRWIHDNPNPMLKYADKIVKTGDTTKLELIGEILFRDEELT